MEQIYGVTRSESVLIQRFWSNVRMANENECWTWEGCTAGLPSPPYGIFPIPRRTAKRAHRVMIELYCGPIPKGMFVLHNCDNPQCVNPNHLRLGTPKDNSRDMVERKRAAWQINSPKWKNRKVDRRQARLTHNQKMAIIKDPRSTKELATAYGVHRATIDRTKAKYGNYS